MTQAAYSSSLYLDFSLINFLIGLFGLFVIIYLYLLWRKTRQTLQKTTEEKDQLEGEENRMFAFLHTLGLAIEQDHSEGKLHREIVDGLVTVVDAVGGAIYLLDDRKRYLLPTHLSEHCPQLIGLPVEVREKAKLNPRAIKSAIRLSKIPADEGMLGSILSSGVAQHVPDVKNHDTFRDAFVHFDEEISALVAPMSYAGSDIGLLIITRTPSGRAFSESEFKLFQSASEQSAFALGNAKIHHEANEKRIFENELRIARDVQSILLPNKDPDISGYRIMGTNSPARIISGDYFDYIPLGPPENGKTAIVIADVTGKGVAAGLLMAMCRSALRCELLREQDPLEALSRVNKQIFADIREDMFISLALYILNDKDGSIQLVCAGHDKAPLMRKNGDLEWIKPPGLAIGLDDGDVFSRVTKLHDIKLESGDCLLLYTDGVTEAMNPQQDEYGRERMASAFKSSAPGGAEHIVDELSKDLKTFVNGYHQMDDITIIAIEKR
ncbi:MAG: sigma-B regulation protein RsbU (phosphoserine phosphatase) [Rubritalea sp.]|jgi:sigma-B regulation protein RsbU (phosphoserine phosphatase)|tara:strand:+ start:764 stop:2251 length:1488 start_codon:yes stop_codon:yes gene_type:complete